MSDDLKGRSEYLQIYRYWYPLALTWLMMAVEGPFLTAIAARMPDPKINLAAFGIALAIGLMVESPVVMLLAAATRLVKCQQSYKKLRKYSLYLSLAVSLVMVVLPLPGIYQLWTSLLDLPSDLLDVLQTALILILPWPGMIGVRRFYQGVLIAQGQSKKLVPATLLRLLGMSITAGTLYYADFVSGAGVATASLGVGVTLEALYVVYLARQQVDRLPPICSDSLDDFSFKDFVSFYYPLALTVVVSLSIQPMISFAMSFGVEPIQSLAVVPVINGVVFFFRAMALSYQEVIIALLGKSETYYQPLKRFALSLGAILTIVLLTIALTPLADLWFIHVSGLTASLTSFSRVPLLITFVIPALSLWLCWQRSICVHYKNTKPITVASSIELFFVLLPLIGGIYFELALTGASLAMLSLVFGRLCANAYLHRMMKFHRT